MQPGALRAALWRYDVAVQRTWPATLSVLRSASLATFVGPSPRGSTEHLQGRRRTGQKVRVPRGGGIGWRAVDMWGRGWGCCGRLGLLAQIVFVNLLMGPCGPLCPSWGQAPYWPHTSTILAAIRAPNEPHTCPMLASYPPRTRPTLPPHTAPIYGEGQGWSMLAQFGPKFFPSWINLGALGKIWPLSADLGQIFPIWAKIRRN